jgi:hypothetical protein
MIYIVIGCNGPHRWGLTFNAFQPVMSNTERRTPKSIFRKIRLIVGLKKEGAGHHTQLRDSHRRIP